MGKLDDTIDAVFADMNVPQHPGAALLVSDHDEVIYRKCYGFADLETRRPITTDTSFYLGSISKPFTAMAVTLLVEDERLSYDDRLGAFFPQFPSWSTEISVRHLVHHTSGLPEYVPLFSSGEEPFEWAREVNSSGEEPFEWAREVNGLTNEAVLQRAMALTGPAFPAGAQYAYSGMVYVLLAMIVATVSGQPFAEFLKARIFVPLGMNHTVAYDQSRPARLPLGAWLLEAEGSVRAVRLPNADRRRRRPFLHAR